MGIHIPIGLCLGDFSLPIVTVKPVLFLKFDLIQAVNECMCGARALLVSGEEQCEVPLEIKRLLCCT